MAAGLIVSGSNLYLRADMEPFKIVCDWTGNADVALSAAIANTLKQARVVTGLKAPYPERIKGRVSQVDFSPGASGDRATYLPLGTYGVTILKANNYDILDGNGAARSISAAEIVVFDSPVAVDEDLTLTIVSTATTDQLAGDGAFASVANWTLGAGWSDGTGHVHKGAGSGTLTHAGASAFAATAGRKYDVTYTIASWAAAANRGLKVTCGGVDGTTRTTDGTYTDTITATGTGGLIFTPTGSDAANVACALDDVTVKFTDPQGRVTIYLI